MIIYQPPSTKDKKFILSVSHITMNISVVF